MKIVIKDVPCAQKRMKVSSRGGFSRVYDPSAKEKNKIKAEIKKQSDLELFDHPRVSFIFHMPIPASLPKKKAKTLQSGKIKHEKKPDVDNFIKLYLDCMDGILFEGDQKVTLGNCVKLYHPEPKTIIFIQEKQEQLSPDELDDLIRAEVFDESIPSQTVAQLSTCDQLHKVY